MQLSSAQLDLLQEFEQGLDPQEPERSQIPATVLGYGEISTVFAIDAEGLEGLAFKRMPLFDDAGEIQAYQAAYEEYCRLLQQEAGLRLPATWVRFPYQPGRPAHLVHHPAPPSICHHRQPGTAPAA